jgi:hypothetical protein
MLSGALPSHAHGEWSMAICAFSGLWPDANIYALYALNAYR